jgi:succinate dehydrogenase flavin-adding protein (antitoxin of CptAB toxin-antitoxin module)
MIKSSYQGDLMLDLKFDHYLEKLKKKQLGLFKILHKKDIDAYQLLKKRLKIDEKKDVQIIDIFNNQYEVLSIIFNLR